MSTAHYGRAVPLALRRFVPLPCRIHSAEKLRTIGAITIPKELPTGVHVVLMLTRQKHIEHADSWLGVRTAWERLLAEQGTHVKGEMQMYICCFLPKFLPLRLMWRWRMRNWAALLKGEDHDKVHVISTRAWTDGFYEKMQIHDDGRAYAMVVRNDGEILWASHDKFQENLQESEMVHTVKQECQWRQDEAHKLLQGGATEVIEENQESNLDSNLPEKR
eukprot:TRINITY_DN97876_c0_g1_i1.p1 TRINITY_DN97876_c0_g1~~TRINITY_DN97876_c0_g1_i1.p1  ORF type:complete len:219 (-),score=34.80 TRINITY_DN97876_c0_g1_i1:96-752(-)